MSLKSPDKGKKTIFSSLGILGIVALKFKAYLLGAWKLLAVVKLGWLLSPILTIGMYAMFFGWPFAIAIILLLFIHEMGHWIWMKALGLEPKAPIFVPFVGAYVAMTKLPNDQATHAWVALAGPLVGGVGSAALYWGGVQSSNHWLMAAGSVGFFLNLLQLVPAKPLDGGFVIQAISRWLLIPGTGLLFALSIYFHSILLLVVSALSFFSLLNQFMHRKPRATLNVQQTIGQAASQASADTTPQVRYLVGADGRTVPLHNQSSQTVQTKVAPRTSDEQIPATPLQRVVIAIAYLGLAGMLAYLYWLSTNELITFMPHH